MSTKPTAAQKSLVKRQFERRLEGAYRKFACSRRPSAPTAKLKLIQLNEGLGAAKV